jgi:hypothetical protein
MSKVLRAARIKTALDTAYGPRGLSRMAADAGISKQLLSFIVAGDREVTDDVYRKIAEALLKEAVRERAAAKKIDDLADRMLAELD